MQIYRLNLNARKSLHADSGDGMHEGWVADLSQRTVSGYAIGDNFVIGQIGRIKEFAIEAHP